MSCQSFFVITSGVFRGGHGAMPPLWPDHDDFLQATYEKVRFLPFSSKNCKIQLCLMVFFHTDTIGPVCD